MSFGIPVRNGLGIGLLSSTFLSSRVGTNVPPTNVIFDRANDAIRDRAGQIIEAR
jgi:hypothetical protein